MTEITRPDGSRIEYVYDPVTGKLTQMLTAEGTYQYFYHPSTGQLSQVTSPQGNSESSQAVEYAWNGPLPTHSKWVGQVQGTIEIDYRFDFLENLRFVSVQGEPAGRGYVAQYGYDRDGLLQSFAGYPLHRSLLNGLVMAATWQGGGKFFEYSTYGEITNRLYRSAGSEFWNSALTRDKLGRITTTQERLPGGVDLSTEYRYDAANRLESVLKNGSLVSSYTYDSNGNRLSMSSGGVVTSGTYDGQDRLLSYGDEQFTYNENGEIISRTNSSAGESTNYTYSAFGNLRSATLPDGKVIRYVIDDQGRRIGKKVNGTMTQMFLYENALRPAAELDGQGSLKVMYFYATVPNSPDRMAKKNTDGSFSTYTFLHDDRGSIRYVLDSAGSIVQEIDYNEFGIVTKDTNPGFQPFGFAGGIYDPDTKLTHFGAREYDASTGRWTTKDPVLFAGGDTNLYGYVLNDPINLIDPTGLSGADTNRILMYSNQIINRMTNLGLRTSNPYMNNIQRSLGDLTGDRVGNSMLLGCYEQAYVTQNHLEGKQYDDQWSFTSQNNGVHHWIEGRSSNSNDPVLRIDPWKGTIETR